MTRQGTKRRRNAEKNKNNNNNNNTKRARKAAAAEAKLWPKGKPVPMNLERNAKELAALRRLLADPEHFEMTNHDMKFAEMKEKDLTRKLLIPFLTEQAKKNAEEEATELNEMAGIHKGGKRYTRRKRGTRRA